MESEYISHSSGSEIMSREESLARLTALGLNQES